MNLDCVGNGSRFIVSAAEQAMGDARFAAFSHAMEQAEALVCSSKKASLNSDQYNMDNCRRVRETREATVKRLRDMGFEVLPSQANFVFARHPGVEGETLYQELKARGVLVRHFDAPRIADYLHITIGTPDQMDVLMEKLNRILGA